MEFQKTLTILFVKQKEVKMAINTFDFFPDAPVALVGELVTGETVTIELWEDGVPVSGLTSNACSEINATGKFSWSIGNILTMSKSRQQFHWRMTEQVASGTFEGDFILQSPESNDGGMPSLNNKGSYIIGS